MWTSGFVIFALTAAVRCGCPWKECTDDISYSLDEALLYAKDESPVSAHAQQPGFEKELPGVYFLNWWIPVHVSWYVDNGYLMNLGDLSRRSWDNVQKCTLTSDEGVLLKNTVEGRLNYEKLQEHFDYTSVKFPYWTMESTYLPTAHYKFAFDFIIEYNSTFCELTDIHWSQSEGSYVMSSWDWKQARIFRFDVPVEHIRQLKGQIHLYFDNYVVKSWCTKYRYDSEQSSTQRK